MNAEIHTQRNKTHPGWEITKKFIEMHNEAIQLLPTLPAVNPAKHLPLAWPNFRTEVNNPLRPPQLDKPVTRQRPGGWGQGGGLPHVNRQQYLCWLRDLTPYWTCTRLPVSVVGRETRLNSPIHQHLHHPLHLSLAHLSTRWLGFPIARSFTHNYTSWCCAHYRATQRRAVPGCPWQG